MLSKLANDTSYPLNYDNAKLNKRAMPGLGSINFDVHVEEDVSEFAVAAHLPTNSA